MNRPGLAACLLGAAVMLTAATASAQGSGQPAPPAFPKAKNLIPFYVSALTRNHYFIDGSTLRVDADGVVRYVLVVKTAGGATDVSFEGMRCASEEYRFYAFGRGDGTWAKSWGSGWRPIEDTTVNRDHAALYGYFCPEGMPIVNADAARNALRQGGSTY